jgi:phosphate transport system protein
MKEHYTERLESLRRQLIGMGAEVESQIRRAIEALVTADADEARRVIEGDHRIDEMEVKNEEDAIHLLATQQPVAGDLRLLVAALKINAGLERIGDHAVNIAEAAERLAPARPFKPWVDIPHMAEVAREMLRDALDAFVRRDPDLARKVCERDDVLDAKNLSLIRELLTQHGREPGAHLEEHRDHDGLQEPERVGDLATNIAEEAIYLARATSSSTATGRRARSPPAGWTRHGGTVRTPRRAPSTRATGTRGLGSGLEPRETGGDRHEDRPVHACREAVPGDVPREDGARCAPTRRRSARRTPRDRSAAPGARPAGQEAGLTIWTVRRPPRG